MMPKLMYVISEDWFFCSHFLERAVAAQAAGYDVAVMTREQAHGEQIRAAGIRLLRLETGIHQPEAVGLYRRAGFLPCAAFGPYAAMPPAAIATSLFFAKPVAPRCGPAGRPG